MAASPADVPPGSGDGPAVDTDGQAVAAALARCLSARDEVGYLQVLAVAPLYLPVPTSGTPGSADPDRVPGPGGATGQRVLTRIQDGRTYLVVFSSRAAMATAVGDRAGGWRPTSLAELAAGAPPAPWGLSVDPGTPSSTELDGELVTQVATIMAAQPPFRPAGHLEERLYRAVTLADPARYLELLTPAELLVPVLGPTGGADSRWHTGSDAAGPYLCVYTSAERLAEHPGAANAPTVATDLHRLLRHWPHPQARLWVNPGSAIEVGYPAAVVRPLVEAALAATTVNPEPPTPRQRAT